MSAIFSECGRYRYALERPLVLSPRFWLLWVGLNPSTAGAENNDATVSCMIRFTRDFGYDGLLLANMYAYRATQPRELWRAPGYDRIGPMADEHLNNLARRADDIVVCWGANANRDPTRVGHVKTLLRRHHELHTLGFTKGGHPVHPLRQLTSLQMQRWNA